LIGIAYEEDSRNVVEVAHFYVTTSVLSGSLLRYKTHQKAIFKALAVEEPPRLFAIKPAKKPA